MTRWPGSFPLFVAEAAGGRLTDVDGIEYVDFASATPAPWAATPSRR